MRLKLDENLGNRGQFILQAGAGNLRGDQRFRALATDGVR